MSAQAKHTPGPWLVGDVPCSLVDGPPPDWAVVGLNDEDGFAETIAYCHPSNAPIVAAAPELLALLTEASTLMPLDGTKKRAEWVVRAATLLAELRGEA
jgi:hypothetical protein